MAHGVVLAFTPFCFDTVNGRLWRKGQEIPLRPKTLSVLRVLVERNGQLVTKSQLLDAVWSGAAVSEGTLAVTIRELRHALGDDPKAPRYIMTVHGRGYRFIAPLGEEAREMTRESHSISPLVSTLQPSPSSFVSRETELTQLHDWFEKALHGERQVVFVTGEAGIGKTTLVEAFRQRLQTEDRQLTASLPASSLMPHSSSVSFAYGQCIEHYGEGEGYLPLLEALSRLGRGPEGDRLVTVLRRYAPLWLVQLPSLVSAADLATLQPKVAGATRPRMLREMTEALAAFTAEIPLVLVLEDLHWSDVSTLDVLAALARQPEPARLLVIGTYRPAEALGRGHPLLAMVAELRLHRHCTELPLALLTESAVAQYLAARFPGIEAEETLVLNLARAVYQRTEGNPLFLVAVVDQLVVQGRIEQRDGHWVVTGEIGSVLQEVPNSLHQMIEQQVNALSEEDQRILETASVVGREFSISVLAAGEPAEREHIEERCHHLARYGHFLRAQGRQEWPDGTVEAEYAFLHSLYQEVLYERVPAIRRARLHRQIGERQETLYGARSGERAAELAEHFMQGADLQRSLHYFEVAGENAIQRCANTEAVTHLSKATEVLATMPDSVDRAQQELALLLRLSVPLIALKGYAAQEVHDTLVHARRLCQQLEDSPQVFFTQLALWAVYQVRGYLPLARELGEELFDLAQRKKDPVLLLSAHMALGVPLFYLGEFVTAREHLEQGIALYNRDQHSFLAHVYGQDVGVTVLAYAGWVLWYLGYPEQARQKIDEALALARELAHPHSLAMALTFAARFRLLCKEASAVQEHAEAAQTLSTDHGFSFWTDIGTAFRGWALAEQGHEEEGLEQIHRGLAAQQETGMALGRPTLLALLADTEGKKGRTEEGLAALAEAFATGSQTGERVYEAELYRLNGELLLQQCRSRRPAARRRAKRQAKVSKD